VGIAYDSSNGYIYVANFFSSTVSVINGATNTVIATIPVGSMPAGVAYDPSNGYIYVTNYGSGTVSIISTSVSANSTSPSVVPTWAVVVVVVVVVLIVALLMIKHRKP